MTILTGSTPPVVRQDKAESRHDLVADISALTARGSLDASALQTRPAILRRLAGHLANVIPPGIDRLVARASTDASLATAVALHTGVPFALLGDDGRVVLGDIYPSERAVLVQTLAAAAVTDFGDQLRAAGVVVVGIGTAVVVGAVDQTDSEAFTLAAFHAAQLERDAHE